MMRDSNSASKTEKMKLKERVIEIIKENIEWKGEINMENNLVEDLDIDSFSMLMIINTLEEDFSIHIEDEDLEGVRTVSDIVEKLIEMLSVKQ